MNSGSNEDFTFGLRPNLDVFKPDNDQHVRAIKALETIGVALRNDSFFDVAATQLFPPPATSSGGPIVRGTQDWVLFHRRRNKKCESTAVEPPPRPVETTCQTVYRIVFGSDEFKQFQSVLTEGAVEGPNKRPILVQESITKALKLAQLIGTVSFKAKTTEVPDNSLQNVINQWNTAGDGQILAPFVLIGADELSFSTELRAQTEKVFTALGGVGMQKTDGEVKKGHLPPGCRSIAIMVVKPPTEQTCVTVIRVFNPDNINLIAKDISAGNTNIINIALAEQFGPIFGKVFFKKGTTEVANNSLAPLHEKINAENLGASVAVEAFVVGTNTATPADKTAFQDQARFLRQTFSGTPSEPPLLLTAPLPPQVGCPALLFLSISSFKP